MAAWCAQPNRLDCPDGRQKSDWLSSTFLLYIYSGCNQVLFVFLPVAIKEDFHNVFFKLIIFSNLDSFGNIFVDPLHVVWLQRSIPTFLIDPLILFWRSYFLYLFLSNIPRF